MTDLTTARPTFPVIPSPVPVLPSPDGTTLITEQQVMFGTAAAVALPRVQPGRWASMAAAVSHAMSALFTDSRPPAQRYRARRFAYLEDALMSREMGRL
jgi:hypothetical protein